MKADVKQVATFGTISIATTILDFMVFNALVFLDVTTPVIANTISYSAGILASYGLNKHLTFSGGGRANRAHELGLFVLLNIAALGLNNGAVLLADRIGGESPLLLNAAKLLAGVITWGFKFVTFRRWVYPTPAG